MSKGPQGGRRPRSAKAGWVCYGWCMRILVTGGAGFIGSHTCVHLLQAGHDVVVVDNLSNASMGAVERIQQVAGRPLAFHRVDLLDEPALLAVFKQSNAEAVVHFAGLKAVGESVQQPLRYYGTNITSTVNLLRCMETCGVFTLAFSSSCTVYGMPQRTPLDESHPLGAINPYGRTKLLIEEMLGDVAAADARWRVAVLRYFNPVGAHPSGLMGEDPRGVPNNLMPYVMKVAVGELERVNVYGSDYDTPDGTGVRDYIHVMDLASGHLAALEGLTRAAPGCVAVNLGTGRGHSVLEVLAAVEAVVGKPVPRIMAPRRAGDAPAAWADAGLAARMWGFKAQRTLEQMCQDAWKWQQKHPRGYDTGV